MDFWLKTCLLLCSYGFFKELRPSESFLTEYLLGPHHNLTENEVYFDVYPVWTYSYLSLLVVVFLVTDILRYKPVIVFEGIGYVVTWSLLLWAKGVHWMQFMEFCYGIATSTEVAYYTYIYAQVDARYYQKVTSYTRSAILCGRFFSGFLSQLLYSTGLMDYHSLNYISLGSVIIALIIAIILPPVKTSVYFHREAVVDTREVPTGRIDATSSSPDVSSSVHLYSDDGGRGIFSRAKLKKVAFLIWRDFVDAYSNKYLLKWSAWWAFATCINFQVGNYIQPLWESISPFQKSESIYNGAVEAMSTLFGTWSWKISKCFGVAWTLQLMDNNWFVLVKLPEIVRVTALHLMGALAAFSVGYIHLNWTLVGEITLSVISLIDAILLLLMGLTSHIWVAYLHYVAFRVSYQVLITVASYQVAKALRADSYGLVFGINMFVALFLQSLLTVIVVEWLEVEPGMQFVIYGCYFGILSFLFFVMSCYGFGVLGVEGIRSQGLWERDVDVSERNEAPVGTTEPY